MDALQQDLRDVKHELKECADRYKADLQKDASQRDIDFVAHVRSLEEEKGRLQEKELLLLRAQSGTDASSAGAGPRTLSDLQRRLSSIVDRPDPRVMQDLIRFCAPQLPFADDQLLQQLYLSVAAAPHSTTRALVRSTADIVFNGPFSGGWPARAVLLIGFEHCTKPVLAKFTLDPEDVLHEHNVLKALWEEPAVPNIVGPVRLLRLGHGNVISITNSMSVPVKCALLMPLYPATLQHPPTMDAVCVLECGLQLKGILTNVHDKGFTHNDVKGSNVFLTSEGLCVLGDFGAATRMGAAQPREYTSTHWPQDYIMPSTTTDFFMLAVTLLERVGAYKLCMEPTVAMLKAAAQQMPNTAAGMELQTFVLQLLEG